MYHLKQLTKTNFTDQVNKDLIAFRNLYFDQYTPEDKPQDYTKWQKMIIHNNEKVLHYFFSMIYKEEEVIGNFFHFTRLNSKGKPTVKMNIHVDKNKTTQVLATFLKEKIEVLKQPDTILSGLATTPFVANILKEIGFTLGNESLYSKLDISSRDTFLMKQWLTNCPESIMAEFLIDPNQKECEEIASLMNVLLNDMRRPDKTITFQTTGPIVSRQIEAGKKFGRIYNHLILRNSTGKPIGISFISYDQKGATAANQFMTGTLPKYRRKGLAKFMKASIYDFLLTHYPNIHSVYTDFIIGNDRIQNLNESIGFKVIREEQQWVFQL